MLAKRLVQPRLAATACRRLSAGPNPMFDLSGRSCVVTGGGRDIGASCALELARAGADVVVNYFQSEQPASEVVEQIRDMGRQATAVQADVFSQEGVDTLMGSTREFFGGRG